MSIIYNQCTELVVDYSQKKFENPSKNNVLSTNFKKYFTQTFFAIKLFSLVLEDLLYAG